MTIPIKHGNRYIYHFTHIDNLPRILKRGFLANNHAKYAKEHCRSIAEPGIQARRAEMNVTCGPCGKVHDYVPLYFGSLSPMLLAVVNKKNVDQQDILYFEFPIALLERTDVVFTDASANTVVPPSFFSDPVSLDELNWTEIDSIKWGCATDTIRHQRMAEVLVHSQLSVSDATCVVVWNENTKKKVEEIVAKASATKFPPITFESRDRRHYYTHFVPGAGEKGTSIVTGPRGIRRAYRHACKEFGNAERGDQQPKYATLRELLLALRQDFSCIPQTAELVGLKSANGIHKKSVDLHTLDVVQKLRTSPEFKGLSAQQQTILELAAFLHDIGKGPKQRWESSGGLQKVDPDHPIRALPLVVEILTECVQNSPTIDAELLLKLVCYHDLIGEVLGKGRDEHQILDAISDEVELRMLFVLGKADATSLLEDWWDNDEAQSLFDRCKKEIKARKES